MNIEEKTLARIFLENKIFKSDGQIFENLFTEIMSMSETDFRKIKAWGNIGDRKNDGYIDNKGIYFQVFAPEDVRKSYPDIINKIETDFTGLLEQWSPVNEFYFVLNDKFCGVHADAEKTLKSLAEKYKLMKSGFYTADDLILKIVGFLPNIDNITTLDYSVLNQVISHIMKMPLPVIKEEIKTPDWDEKIKFNKLSKGSAYLLNNGSIYLGGLNRYLSNQPFLAEELQNQMNGIYNEIKKSWQDLKSTSDNIFWEIINTCSPKRENSYQSAVITIMSKYFESCDIFEEPQ